MHYAFKLTERELTNIRRSDRAQISSTFELECNYR